MTKKPTNLGASVQARLLNLARARKKDLQLVLLRYANERFLCFGDAITPAAEEIDFPTLLDFPAPKVRVYPKETVVAEKLDAMVQLGLANSRMKDFFDVALLAREFEFDSALLVRAVRATFKRRRTPLPDGLPTALTEEFASDRTKATQWRAFLSKTGTSSEATLPEVVTAIAVFLSPVIAAARSNEPWSARWSPGGPWSR